jgi:hypothetical protein
MSKLGSVMFLTAGDMMVQQFEDFRIAQTSLGYAARVYLQARSLWNQHSPYPASQPIPLYRERGM